MIWLIILQIITLIALIRLKYRIKDMEDKVDLLWIESAISKRQSTSYGRYETNDRT